MNSCTSRKRKNVVHDNYDDDMSDLSVQPHPYGVKPMGNFYFDMERDGFRDARLLGLGMLSCLEDHTINNIMQIFSASDLSRISLVSQAFYVFTQEEDLWKVMCLAQFSGDFVFKGTWKQTYRMRSNPSYTTMHKPIEVRWFYSNFLFHSWRCHSVDVMQWATVENIDRRSSLTLEEFKREYETPNKPVIITDVVKDWPAFAEKAWSQENLIKNYGDIPFYINSGVNMKLKDYFAYVNTVQEENPMYLFDHTFGENCPSMLKDYTVPEYFKEDFFSILGDQRRPNFRWLLIGPPRAGACFHLDPNHTSAWNAVISGYKKWVMYPPGMVPPGVYPSDDGLDVTTPISIAEWFINFYEKPDSQENGGSSSSNSNKKQKTGKEERVRPLECVLKPGEMIYVPTGWWHTVINLTESIAVTQNYCNSHNILNVMAFLKTKRTHNLHRDFTAKFDEVHPGLLESLQREKEEKQNNKKKTFWQQVKPESKDEGQTFKFNF